jgi:hypothetical protein
VTSGIYVYLRVSLVHNNVMLNIIKSKIKAFMQKWHVTRCSIYIYITAGTREPSAQVQPVSGGYKYRDLALQFGGVSRIGKIKYGLESLGTQTRPGLRWRGPAATLTYRPVLSSERALQNNKPAISRRKKNWSRVPYGCLTPKRP